MMAWQDLVATDRTTHHAEAILPPLPTRARSDKAFLDGSARRWKPLRSAGTFSFAPIAIATGFSINRAEPPTLAA
jgi:hypothetical protein